MINVNIFFLIIHLNNYQRVFIYLFFWNFLLFIYKKIKSTISLQLSCFVIIFLKFKFIHRVNRLAIKKKKNYKKLIGVKGTMGQRIVEKSFNFPSWWTLRCNQCEFLEKSVTPPPRCCVVYTTQRNPRSVIEHYYYFFI